MKWKRAVGQAAVHPPCTDGNMTHLPLRASGLSAQALKRPSHYYITIG